MAKPLSLKECSNCHKEVYRLAEGTLCAKCNYEAKRAQGYVKIRKPCSVDGCNELSAAHGLCQLHYKRFVRSGNTEGERYERWGHGASHPLYGKWDYLKRSRTPFVAEWQDFWQFVRDVGDQPSSTHRLYRKDTSKPHGPDNFVWRDRLTDVPLSDRNAYMRAYYASHPERNKHYQLKQQYGIGFEQYEAMRKAQDSKCAICKQPEKAVSKQTGKVRDLAVDHDHVSGAVRDLLCTGCNSILGNANDDITILEVAIAYLKRYGTRTQEVPE